MRRGAENITGKTFYGFLNHIKLIGIAAILVMAKMVDQKTKKDLLNCLNNQDNELSRLNHYYVQQNESGSNLQYHDPKTSFLDALSDVEEVGDIDLKGLVVSESVYPTSLEDKINEEVCMVKKKTTRCQN